jgi:hypothetical protein
MALLHLTRLAPLAGKTTLLRPLTQLAPLAGKTTLLRPLTQLALLAGKTTRRAGSQELLNLLVLPSHFAVK